MLGRGAVKVTVYLERYLCTNDDGGRHAPHFMEKVLAR
jgi:hypothetical protein